MSTETTILDYYRRRNEIRESFPDDLLEFLQEEEPALCAEAEDCDNHIAEHKRLLKLSVAPVALLPSIVTPGWNAPRRNKFSKNWPDMENLLKLYALGLYFKGKPMSYQANHDQEELTSVVETASISPKHKNGIPAQKRLENAKTYLRFGLRTLDAFFTPDSAKRQYEMHDLDCEIYDTSNEYNADKLRRSKDMALRVGRIICERYNSK